MIKTIKTSPREKFPQITSKNLPKSPPVLAKLDFRKLSDPNVIPVSPKAYNEAGNKTTMVPIKIDEPYISSRIQSLNDISSPKNHHTKFLNQQLERKDSNNSDRGSHRGNHLDVISEIEILEQNKVSRQKTIKYLSKNTPGSLYCTELWGKNFYEGILKKSGIDEIFEDQKRMGWISSESRKELQETHLMNKFPKLKSPATETYSLHKLKEINNFTSYDPTSSRRQSTETIPSRESPIPISDSHSQNFYYGQTTSRFAKYAGNNPEISHYFNIDSRRTSHAFIKPKPLEKSKISNMQTIYSAHKDSMSAGFHSARAALQHVSTVSTALNISKKGKDMKGTTFTSMNFSKDEIKCMSNDTLEMLGKFESLHNDIQTFQTENSEFKHDIKNLSIEGIKDFQPNVIKNQERRKANKQDKVLLKLKKVVKMDKRGKPSTSEGLTPLQMDMKRRVKEIESKFNETQRKKVPLQFVLHK